MRTTDGSMAMGIMNGAVVGAGIPDLPLLDRRIVVTRARSQADELSRRLREAGADAIEMPMIRFHAFGHPSQHQSTIHRLDEFDWIVFSSGNAISYFLELIQEADIPHGVRLACVGKHSAEVLSRHGLEPDFVPQQFSGHQLAAQLPLDTGQKVLCPGPTEIASGLVESLQSRGAIVERLPIYETVSNELTAGQLQRLESKIDGITFASPSAVDSFCQQVQHHTMLSPGCVIACIGPTTGQKARELGLNVDIVPQQYSIPGLVKALVQYFADAGERHG